ncbi:MAG: TetR/AcrR family transcriptional regulator [Alphaproteobacteria bacterium]|nr:TetR/AcrR family transcriptional regulator [Alphaproteobacteria bacterium]
MQRSIEPRKKPRQARAAATVEAILQAAAHILEREGLAALNTNHIAERAGVSVGSLYQYFPTKQAIMTEIIRRKRRRLVDAITLSLQAGEGESFDERLDRLIAAAIEHQIEWPRLARNLEIAEAFLPLQEETEALNQALADKIGCFLGHQGIGDVAVATMDLIALVRGMIDAAGLAGETDRTFLAERIGRAARGYLLLPQAAVKTRSMGHSKGIAQRRGSGPTHRR